METVVTGAVLQMMMCWMVLSFCKIWTWRRLIVLCWGLGMLLERRVGVRAILFLMLCEFGKEMLLPRCGWETWSVGLELTLSKRLTVGSLICNPFTSENLSRWLCKAYLSDVCTTWLTSTCCWDKKLYLLTFSWFSFRLGVCKPMGVLRWSRKRSDWWGIVDCLISRFCPSEISFLFWRRSLSLLYVVDWWDQFSRHVRPTWAW